MTSADAAGATGWLPDEARLIALVCERGGDEWAAGVAVGLADMVGRERGRTFLANVSGAGGDLEALLRAESGPGLTSALTGVATIAAVARSSPEQRFAYLPAGDAALPYTGLCRMQAFRRFLDKVRQRGGTLLLFVSEDDLASSSGSRGASQPLTLDGCVALGDPRGIAARLGAPMLARVERPAPPPEPALEQGPEAETTEAPETVNDVGFRAGSLTRLVAPLALAILLWAGWAMWPSSSPDDEAIRGVDAGVATTPEASDATRGLPSRAEAAEPEAAAPRDFAGPLASYSVLVGSYIRLDDANQRRDELAAAGGLFFVAPTPVRGRTYYRVLAGVYEDRADAATAMSSLVADGRKDAVKEWDIRPVRLAYDLGTFAERGVADRRRDEMRRNGIPAYVLRDTAEAPLYRVFAGAFRTESDGEPLERMLEERGRTGQLITRSGIAP